MCYIPSMDTTRLILLALLVISLLACGAEQAGPCADVTCSGHGYCVTEGSSPRCECDDDYYSSGLACLPDGDGDADADADGDGDDDVAGDDGDVADADTDVDDDVASAACPDDMVEADGFCIDRYEASRGGGGAAASLTGAEVWLAYQDDARVGCLLADKRLCTGAEWLAACRGPAERTYPYGNTFVAGRCNDAVRTGGAWRRTGNAPECEGGYPGIFDMSGNVFEWTAPCAGNCSARGGDYQSPDVFLRCDGLVEHTSDTGGIGFRCCRDLE